MEGRGPAAPGCEVQAAEPLQVWAAALRVPNERHLEQHAMRRKVERSLLRRCCRPGRRTAGSRWMGRHDADCRHHRQRYIWPQWWRSPGQSASEWCAAVVIASTSLSMP